LQRISRCPLSANSGHCTCIFLHCVFPKKEGPLRWWRCSGASYAQPSAPGGACFGRRGFHADICRGKGCDGYHNRMDFTPRLRQFAPKCAPGHRTGRVGVPTSKLKLASNWCPQNPLGAGLGAAVRSFLPGWRPLCR
jgi:hypothetical protein